MYEIEHVIKELRYCSDVVPHVFTTEKEKAAIIAWGDANPTAWRVIRQARSGPFGRNSFAYHGWARGGDTAEAILDRLAIFHNAVQGDKRSIFTWRAQFTLDHYDDKGFKGGHFDQFDGEYHRGVLDLDYTPATLDEVVDQFRRWCGQTYPTQWVELNGSIIWRIGDEKKKRKGAA